MKLRKLSIRRMPGFEERGFELAGLSSQLSVITGPNGSGKTTACRSLRGLLWPETLKGASPISLAGDWEEGGKSLTVDLEGPNLKWQRDGVSSEIPPLPGVHLASCFTVTIDDLISGSKTDADLAERVAREMAGGYDLKSVRNLKAFRLSRTHGRKELKELENAKGTVGIITAEQQALRVEEEELTRLEREEKEARNARTRLSMLQDARDLISIRAEIREIGRIIGELPKGMDRIRGDESHKLEQVLSDIDAAEQELQAASEEAMEAMELKEATQLPDAGIDALHIEEQKSRLENLRETADELRNAVRCARDADEKVRSALRTLGDSPNPDKLDAIDIVGLDRISEYHRTAEDVKSRRLVLEAKLASLGNGVPLHDTEALVNGINVLRMWFEVGPSEQKVSLKQLVLIWCLIGFTVITAVALALFHSAWWALLLLSAGMIGMGAWFLRRPTSDDMRAKLQEQYNRLGVDRPDSWDREVVGEHLNVLERTFAETLAAAHDSLRRNEIEEQLESLHDEEDSIEQRHNELVQKLGISPDTSPLALTVFATNLLQYREVKAMRDAANKQVAALKEEHNRQLQPINAFLLKYGESQCDSYDFAHLHTENIERRAAQHYHATVQLAVAQKNIDLAKNRMAEYESRKRQLFIEVSLEENDEQGLRDRLAHLPDYNKSRDEIKNLRAREVALVSRLEEIPEMLDLSIEQINAETDRWQRIANDQDSLYNRILDIRARISSTASGSRLEDALVEVEHRKDALAERQNEAMLAAAGNFLLDQAEAEYEVESRPAVFLLASKWLSMFTRGRYELRHKGATESESPVFRAFDTVNNRGLATDELSRGTCIQLLLAVRLAFASKAERGTRLPFIFDEVLSSSDPVRFRAIAECVLAMVGDGRQVLYFTCQPSDAIAWQEIAENTGITDARMIDLSDVRSGERVEATLLAKSATESKKVPDPGKMSVSEYVNVLGVPALDPPAGARAAHISNFVEDTRTLYQLLSAGVETFGQLESLVSFGAADAYLEKNALSQMRVRACILDAFAEAWRIGRGKPVCRDILATAGISDSFIDRVTHLARDLNWDAKRLTQALQAREDERAKGFRSEALEKVTDNLTESGHFDPRAPLSEEEVLVRVLAASNDYVKQGIIEAGGVRELCSKFWQLSIAKIARVPLDNGNAESALNDSN